MSSTFYLSKHATVRIAQRDISPADLEYILEHGERIYRTGLTAYVLRKKDIPDKDRSRSELTRLEGTVVLTDSSQDGHVEIITVYRNKGACKDLRCKTKYDNRKRYRPECNLS